VLFMLFLLRDDPPAGTPHNVQNEWAARAIEKQFRAKKKKGGDEA